MENQIKLQQKKWDPRTKLFLVICLTLLAVLCNELIVLLPVLAVVIISVLCAKNRQAGFSGKRMRQFFLFFVLIAIVQSLFQASGEPLLQLGTYPLLTTGGLRLGGLFLCRILIIMLSAFLLSTENSRTMIQGLIQWKLPYELAFMTSTALHFIPVFTEEIKISLTAIQLRGLDIKQIPLKKRLLVYSYLLLPAIGNAIIRAKEMALAMEMRGFRAYNHRTSYLVLKLSVRDYVAMVLIMAGTMTVLAGYYLGKFSV